MHPPSSLPFLPFHLTICSPESPSLHPPPRARAVLRYADCENPVFFNSNTLMCFGDAKATCDKLLSGVKAAESS